jgi:uncharacterized protein YbjQ (UPF0145 family)
LHPEGLPEAPGWPIHPAMVSTSFEIPGFKVVHNFGVVQGLTVRSPGFSGGISASFQALSGGNVETFRKLCETARREAYLLMMKDAARYRANGIIAFRYDTTEIGEGLTEVLAYGSAIIAERMP